MYFLRPGIKENPQKRWALPDRIFFGYGACHILAGVHLSEFQESGFRPQWIRPATGHGGFHIYLVRGGVAFDFHGYSCEKRLLEHYWKGWSSKFEGWSASVEDIDFDLLDTDALNTRKMRGPSQYFGDPVARARKFLSPYKPRDMALADHSSRASRLAIK